MAEAQLKEAGVKRDNLHRERERLSHLLQKKVISRQRYDDVDTAYSMAVTRIEVIKAQIVSTRENLAMAAQKLKDTVIVAPFSGVIVKRFVNQGEFVSTMPPAPLFLIMNIDTVKTEVQLPEVNLSRVAIGNPVAIIVDAFSGIIFKGTISTVNPMVDPVSRAFTVKVAISNRDQHLKPGMFTRVKISPAIHRNALVVPLVSLMKREGRTFVYVVEGDCPATGGGRGHYR